MEKEIIIKDVQHLARKLFNKDFNSLTSEQKSQVMDIYYY